MVSAEWILGFVLSVLLMLAGLVGSVLPGMPGSPLVFIAALGFRLWFGPESLSLWVLVALGLLMVLSMAVDYLATTAGARQLGASRRGMIGAVLGAMIGIFFPPIGLLLGPFLGAAALELIGGRDWRESGKAGFGATLGFLAGTVGRVACCVAMIGLFVLNALLRRL